MFRNDVIVSQRDKDRLMELMDEANKILDKYPYFNPKFRNDMTCTTISRAKTFVIEAKKWCGYLDTSDDRDSIQLYCRRLDNEVDRTH